MRQLITTPTQLGEILRARRKARHLPQQALAQALGIGQSRLSTLESQPGELSLARVLLLAKLLGLELVVQDAKDGAQSKAEW